MPLRQVRSSNLAIFTGQLGLSLLHTSFNFYYVKVFLNVFKVNEYWFNVAQVLYLIWNAVNDPLFGYIQDVGGTWMKSRSLVFSRLGPLLFLSFLVLWFPWGSSQSPAWVEGWHLIVGLFLYDAFYSCLGVAWGALFAESTRDHRMRVQAMKYSQVAILCSVNVIIIAEKVSHSLDNFLNFQYVCLTVAALSGVCFYLTSRLAVPAPSSRERLLSDEDSPVFQPHPDWSTVLKTTRELLSAKDLQLIIATNFIHTCRSVGHLNFASIATEIVIPQRVLAKGSWQLSAFFAVCTLLPQLVVISGERTIVHAGAFHVAMFGYLCSVLSGFLYVLGYNSYVVIFFMIIDSITVHATAPLFNIFLAEFIEQDTTRNSRRSALSSIIFSLNALIIKPSSSIAPIVIVYLLNRSGYEVFQQTGIVSAELTTCMRRILFATPLLLGGLELFLFRSYSIRHGKAKSVALPM